MISLRWEKNDSIMVYRKNQHDGLSVLNFFLGNKTRINAISFEKVKYKMVVKRVRNFKY